MLGFNRIERRVVVAVLAMWLPFAGGCGASAGATATAPASSGVPAAAGSAGIASSLAGVSPGAAGKGSTGPGAVVSAGTGGVVSRVAGSAGASGGSGAAAGASSAAAGGNPAGAGGTGGTGSAPASAAGGGSPEPAGPGPVDLAGGVTGLFPRPDGAAVCPDPTLRLVFDGKPRLGSSGSIHIRNSTSSSEIAAIDPAQDSERATIGGTEFNLTAPVEVDGNDVVVRLPAAGLEYGQRYQVIVDSGAIMGPSGPVEIAAGTWEFSTQQGPPSDLAKLRVAADGSGDFCSVQRAIDALPDMSTTPREIEIARGVYRGVIHFSKKQQLTLRGEDRKATILRGVNNDNMNGGTAKRALIGIDQAQDLTIENLTIHNQTPQGGSQAEALRLQRCERCVVRDADILSLQDTLLWSGKVYARNCYIEGNVDYIWGTGAAFFEECEIKTVGRAGYNVQSRNDANGYGYVFVSSRLTSDSGVTGDVLARVDASAYPASHVAYIDCEMGPHIKPEGWSVTGPSGSVRFWEYKSVTPAGRPVDTSRRHAASKQLSDAEAAMMRDPSVVLGGWQPPR